MRRLSRAIIFLYCFASSLKSSEVDIATRLRNGRPSSRGSIPKRREMFLFSTASRPAQSLSSFLYNGHLGLVSRG
jgi:hypothetical protein